MAWTATIAGFGAAAFEQVLRPNVGQVFIDGITGAIGLATDKLSGGRLTSPITNEFLENIKNNRFSEQSKDWINGDNKE
ncbi:hypothetical protein QN360_06540 [Glaciimonas sp. CA11.2]|uniref:hypothetical protein n=1 Tax=Glaciimonas sp. CA11.2 TaxID=3048601 RepID=UPI002AB481DA|nr:hypothetical protein [Glaciimonas sp. CA11.2]MDY7546027.1 hypothetical protein [Glaciimonas sp. CA11.2]MEB0162563.1 hypothetical protein [Glaciimonas sp. CA11.2]